MLMPAMGWCQGLRLEPLDDSSGFVARHQVRAKGIGNFRNAELMELGGLHDEPDNGVFLIAGEFGGDDAFAVLVAKTIRVLTLEA